MFSLITSAVISVFFVIVCAVIVARFMSSSTASSKVWGFASLVALAVIAVFSRELAGRIADLPSLPAMLLIEENASGLSMFGFNQAQANTPLIFLLTFGILLVVATFTLLVSYKN